MQVLQTNLRNYAESIMGESRQLVGLIDTQDNMPEHSQVWEKQF